VVHGRGSSGLMKSVVGLFLVVLQAAGPYLNAEPWRILCLEGYSHKEQIPPADSLLVTIAQELGCGIDITADRDILDPAELRQYDVIVYNQQDGMNETGEQRQALKEFMQGGGGFVGIHKAGANHNKWPWYVDLVGADLDGHVGNGTEGMLYKAPENEDHFITRTLADTFTLAEEWYNWVEDPRENDNITHLLYLDWDFGTSRPDHPITWCQEYDGGRSFYTAMGHNLDTFEDENFGKLLKRGIVWAAGRDDDVSLGSSGRAPRAVGGDPRSVVSLSAAQAHLMETFLLNGRRPAGEPLPLAPTGAGNMTVRRHKATNHAKKALMMPSFPGQ